MELEFVITTGKVECPPVATDPKKSAAGLAVADSLVTPPPPTGSTSVGFDALLVNVIVPPVHPVALGEKFTERSKLSPAGRVAGRVKGDVENSGLLVVTAEIVTLVCPLLVSVISKVSVWPTSSAPNRKLGGEEVN